MVPAQSIAIVATALFAAAAISRVSEMRKSIHLLLTLTFFLSHPLAQAETWQPSAGHVQTPIWPGAVPDAIPDPKPESVGPPEGHDSAVLALEANRDG